MELCVLPDLSEEQVILVVGLHGNIRDGTVE